MLKSSCKKKLDDWGVLSSGDLFCLLFFKGWVFILDDKKISGLKAGFLFWMMKKSAV